MSTHSPLYTTLHTTSLSFIQSFSNARKTAFTTALNAVCAPHCKRFYSPISLASMLHASFATGESNDNYATRMQVEYDMTEAAREPDVRSVVVDEGARKSVVHVVMFTKRKGVEGRVYEFEFAFFLDFDEPGTLIERIQVFADPGMAQKFFEENREIGESVK